MEQAHQKVGDLANFEKKRLAFEIFLSYRIKFVGVENNYWEQKSVLTYRFKEIGWGEVEAPLLDL